MDKVEVEKRQQMIDAIKDQISVLQYLVDLHQKEIDNKENKE